MQHLEELKALLSIPKDIVITTHRNPDGDAIGASLALYHYLNQSGHTVRVMAPSEYPDFLAWMPGASEIMVFDVHTEVCTERLQRADIIFVLDYNDLERVDRMGEVIAPLTCKKVMIDHHLYPESFADFVLSDITASSTCELIYDFLGMLGHLNRIDHKIGDSIFTGILTDTGSFKYSTSAKLFRIVADLIERGVDDVRLQELIFNNMDEKHLRLLGHCLYNRMEILEEYFTGIITLTKEDYEKYNISRGDTEGIVNYLLKLKNVKMAAFIHEQPTITKLSLRSKGEFSVQEIAKQYFKGGGHRNASGGSSYGGLSATLKKFKALLPEYKTQLENA